METPKTIFVTGGTGKQGGAVARNLITEGFKVKVLTRNPNTNAAQSLTKLGIEVVPGDLNQPQTFEQHLQDAAGIFSMQTYENGIATEIKQGINLANLAKAYEVRHFVYSSVVGADMPTGIPHWESKGKIENHIHKLNLPATIIRPTSFYENFLIPQVKSRLLKGKLAWPIDKQVVQQFISTEDIGRISTQIFNNPAKYMSKTLTIAAEQLNMAQVAAVFSEVLGREIKYQQLPSLFTWLFMGKNLYKMFKWVNEHDVVFVKDIEALKKEFPGLMSLRQWIILNFKTT
ncbi:MAG: NmrA/HSCARG family protein [Adhaeribacter sp.]